MNRAIKFKLKNGKEVTVRRICGVDYEVIAKFLDNFYEMLVQTNQYAG